SLRKGISIGKVPLVLCTALCKIKRQTVIEREDRPIMASARVTGIRSIELGVRDLQQSADFYTKIWALEEIGSEGDSICFRGTGSEHHVLTIRQRGKPNLLGVHFAAPDRAAVDALCAKAKGYGVDVEGNPAPLAKGEGGGYGFRFRSPDGLPMSIS